MATKTLIPALRAKVGDWPYYICSMKYAQVAKEVYFAFELNNGNTELATLLQRGIGERTAEIVKYLKNVPGRFLGAIIVAAHGGNPLYHPVQMQDPDGLLVNLDSEFGVLEFNGSQSYFALDGQHRLKAIKDVVKQNPELGDEDICVLIVSHADTEQGRERTRRLFTNINKHAKVTTKAENIALDEDDSAAIITRWLLLEHPFLKVEGRVRVIGASGSEGQLKLATGNVMKTDPAALFTIGGLYELVSLIIEAFQLPSHGCDKSLRPADDVLEKTYDEVVVRLDQLMNSCGDIESHLAAALSARDVRAPKVDETRGHPFMRAIVQRVVMKVAEFALTQHLASWDEIQQKLSGLTWQLSEPPWDAVVSVDGTKVKMLTSRDYVGLLQKLLIAHLCPKSKVAVTTARKEYKRLKGRQYPVSEEVLIQGISEPETPQEVPEPAELPDMTDLAESDSDLGTP